MKLLYRENAQPEVRWILVVEELGKGNQVFRLFVPCVAYTKAEDLAERLDPGDLITLQGRLCWRSAPATKKDPNVQGKLTVLVGSVDILSKAAVPVGSMSTS